MEPPGRRVGEWRVSILDKGLKVNSGMSKVMVGSSGGKMIANSGKRSCGLVVCLPRPMESQVQEIDNALAQSSEDNKALAGLVSNRSCTIPLKHLSANIRRKIKTGSTQMTRFYGI